MAEKNFHAKMCNAAEPIFLKRRVQLRLGKDFVLSNPIWWYFRRQLFRKRLRSRLPSHSLLMVFCYFPLLPCPGCTTLTILLEEKVIFSLHEREGKRKGSENVRLGKPVIARLCLECAWGEIACDSSIQWCRLQLLSIEISTLARPEF